MSSRREFLKSSTVLSLAALAFTRIKSFAGILPPAGKFELPALGYNYDELEPYIDKMTMEIHHSKHHKSYVENLNTLLESLPAAQNKSIEELCANISQFPIGVRNNGGGHFNHSLFWKIMSPDGGEVPTGEIASAIDKTFGSFENFKTKFTEEALQRFGSGWAWLVLNNGKLEIGSTPNQDNPLMDISKLKGKPVLAVDVWEHAYYLKHQNKRADYLKAWWGVINWNQVEKNYLAAK